MSESEIPEPIISAREKLNLIIDQGRNLPPEYSSLILKQESRDEAIKFQRTPYSEGWDELRYNTGGEEARNFFVQRLKGHSLIDLGGGEGFMRGLASQFGVAEYINVDRKSYNETLPNPFEIHHSMPLSSDPQSFEIDVHSDMLDFVARLKDGAVNITCNGIDFSIVDDIEYHRALAREIVRAIRTGGLVFGIRSIALDEISDLVEKQKIPFRKVNLQKETGFRLIAPLGFDIFEKVE